MATPEDPARAPLILGIETSCDDTACAVVRADGRVCSSLVSSQLAAHRPYGGVVPEIASREHLKNWPAVLSAALEEAGIGLDAVDAVAATRAPGLIGSLLVGLSLGKALARGLDRPFYGVHHLEGHLYSPYLRTGLRPAETPPERFVALVVSGGHTALYRVSADVIETVAETRDDAMGEVFDKVGKRLGLPYPQGPRVDELAEAAGPEMPSFALARCSDGSLDFSFSGLKTETIRALDALPGFSGAAGEVPTDPPGDPMPARAAEILAAFRAAAVGQILDRLERMHRQEAIQLLAVSGGAAANRLLRRRLPEWSVAHGVELRLVDLQFSGDNAAMIAHAAGRRLSAGETGDSWAVEAESRLPLGTARAK